MKAGVLKPPTGGSPNSTDKTLAKIRGEGGVTPPSSLILLLFANLMTDFIFPLIEGLLLFLCYVSAVLFGHVAFIPTDLAVFFLELLRLSAGYFPLPEFLVYASVLIVETFVYLCPAGMFFLPLVFSH
ncbi:MAG: hypothetical protein HQK95_09000 [Nitrospirae bacterium]|nr:hypothetical protein [Nitrospirota bacterium]